MGKDVGIVSNITLSTGRKITQLICLVLNDFCYIHVVFDNDFFGLKVKEMTMGKGNNSQKNDKKGMKPKQDKKKGTPKPEAKK